MLLSKKQRKEQIPQLKTILEDIIKLEKKQIQKVIDVIC